MMESGLKVNKIPQQPIHPSVVPKLDPEYLQFHNEHLQYITPPHTLPWDPSLRNAPSVPGSSEPLVVGKTRDYDLPNTKFRSFTPEGTASSTQGWPVLIYFHGGEYSLRVAINFDCGLTWSSRGLDSREYRKRICICNEHVCPYVRHKQNLIYL
jgi:hypothetical protein